MKCKQSGLARQSGVSSSRCLTRLIRVLVIDGDFPLVALELHLGESFQRTILDYFCSRYVVCQFKDRPSYLKGRRLAGQRIRIGKFQGLVEPLGYQRLPLTKKAAQRIRSDHHDRGYPVAKLADDWDVSESHIRTILKG